MIKYSVIVPVFNSFSSLKVILDWFSVEYRQRNGDIELIVIDDGSTEKPEYNIEYPGVYLFRKGNGGVSSARNLGLKESVGEYVLFLDSDDMYAKGIFNKLDGRLSNEIDATFFSFQKELATGLKIIEHEDRLVSGKDGLESFLTKKCKIHICSVVIRKSCLADSQIIFNEEVHFSEDVLFLVTLLMSIANCQFSSAVLYTYNMRNDSAMASPVSGRNLTHLIAYRSIYTLINDRNYTGVNFFLATCYVNLLKNLMTNKAAEEKTIDEILVNASYLFRPIGMRFNLYTFAIFLARGYILLDKIFKYRISHKLFKSKVK